MSTTVAAGAGEVDSLYRRHLSSGRARVASLLGGQVEVESEGSVVTDASGREYLNCGGYGVFLLGHCHPAVVAAVREQIERHPLASRLFLDPYHARAAEALARAAPAGLERVYFGTSGADAVEAALKLARMTGRWRVVACDGGFHGKTFGALSVSGNDLYRRPFEPLLPGVQTVPFGDAQAIEAAVAAAPGECCVLVEPIQAEAGVRIPPSGWLADVAAACRRHGALLMVDEIATGLGRVGRWWAVERDAVVPDMLLVGKPLGGGVVPVGAVVASDEAFGPLDRDPFMHSATFAGSPIATAAVAATLACLAEERVPERAEALGRDLLARLRDALAGATAAEVVVDVRGVGLLIGIELAAAPIAGDFELALVARGVIPNHCMNEASVVRLTPPATLTEEECDWLCDAVGGAAEAVAAKPRRRFGRR
jgi:putrescine aminotransferase